MWFSMYLQSLPQIMNASMEELARCPGIGERKVLQCVSIDVFTSVCNP